MSSFQTVFFLKKSYKLINSQTAFMKYAILEFSIHGNYGKAYFASLSSAAYTISPFHQPTVRSHLGACLLHIPNHFLLHPLVYKTTHLFRSVWEWLVILGRLPLLDKRQELRLPWDVFP
jgi:hypothetical protein